MARRDVRTETDSTAATGLFGHSRYSAALGVANLLLPAGTRKEIRSQLREALPAAPGAYGFLDERGELIYVGKSNSLRHRLRSYFATRPSRKKDGRIARHIRTVIWQPAIHELIARLRERELIHQYRPNFNVQGHPVPIKFGFLVLTRDDPPVLSLQSRRPRSAQRVWGPVPYAGHLRAALEMLNHHFRLRDCPRDTPLYFLENGPIPSGAPQQPCLRVELQTCLSPCVAGCSRRNYDRAVRQAAAFLDGQAPSFWSDLERDMTAAASERKFELAARLRDRGAALRRLDEWLRRFHDWPEQSTFVSPLLSPADGREWWLAVRRGLARFVVPRPGTTAERAEFERRWHAPETDEGHADGVLDAGDFAGSRLLFRWFRQHPEERAKCLTIAQALRTKLARRDAGTG